MTPFVIVILAVMVAGATAGALIVAIEAFDIDE